MQNAMCRLLLASYLLSMAVVVLGEDRSQSGAASADAGAADASMAERHIDQLARFLRIQNYELYRMDRAQYDRHTEALQQRLENWRRSDRDPQKARELIGWLNRSLGGAETSPQPATRALEPLPVPETSIAAPAELAPQFKQKQSVGSSGVPNRPLVKTEINAIVPPLPDEETDLPETKLPNSGAAPDAPRLSSTFDPATENSIASGLQSTINSLVRRVDEVAPLSNLPNSVPPPVTLPELTDVPDAPPFVSPAFVPKTVPQLSIEVPKIGGLADLRSSRRRPSAPSTMGAETKGRVSFTEVAALTRSYNASLKVLETKLSKPTKWTAEELEPLVDQLEDLDRRREDLKLYETALPAEERSQLLSLESQNETIRLLSKRIVETRNSLTASTNGEPSGRDSSPDGPTGSATTARRDLAQLDGFSRKLAQLAAKNER